MGRKQIALTVLLAPPALIFALVMGLIAYMTATTRPIHADPKGAPSVMSSAPLPKWTPAIEQAQRFARAGLTEQNLPGLSVAVAAGSDIVWAEGFGYADVDKKLAVTPETRFRVADASTTLTSAAVGLLLENNKLHLDDEIQLHVPEFPKKPWPVTLRQLMANVAGVTTDHGGEAPLSNASADDGNPARRCERTVDGLRLDDFADRELLFEPGTKFSPSSYSWVLVSAAVEAAANEPFYSFMRTQVFEPLGMRDTTVDVSNEAIPARATFYFVRFGLSGDTRYGPKSVRQGDYSCYAGAAAFLSTPSDLVRFGIRIGHLRQGFGAQGTLLKPDTVQQLQTPQRLASGKETGNGLGWALETVSLASQPARMAGQGSKEGFIGGSTYLMTFPERRLVVAVMANISFADTKSVALKIADVFAATAWPSR